MTNSVSRFGTHDRGSGLVTEKVSQGVEVRPGQYGTDTFWIAYPPSILAYGHEDDRISRAWGKGDLRREALAEAQKRVDDGWPIS
jgi:hypothetical protein